MNYVMDIIEKASDRSYIAIILVIAAFVCITVAWGWTYFLQKKIEKIEKIYNKRMEDQEDE